MVADGLTKLATAEVMGVLTAAMAGQFPTTAGENKAQRATATSYSYYDLFTGLQSERLHSASGSFVDNQKSRT